MFPPELVEAAFFFYFEFSPSRVKYLLRVSETGAANKLKAVLKHLEMLAALPEHGPYDAAALRTLGLVGADRLPLADGAVAHRRRLAPRYLEYFRLVKENVRGMSHLSKKNDAVRANALSDGESIV